MTDLSPNDLSHLSDEEFNALCPQGYHAPGPEPLSPAAQAVDHAIAARIYLLGEIAPSKQVAAAALRAAADQLINVKWSVEMQDLHHEFHVIATELEAL